MTNKSKIITLPQSVLRQPSQKVGLINQDILNLVDQMIKQAILWEESRSDEITVGLAAVQINQPFKVIIVRDNFEAKTKPSFTTFINPKITKYIGPQKIQLEGCLSVPNYYVNVKRFNQIKLSALNLNGEAMSLKAEGFLARILQHEVDHLKGITIVDQAVEDINEKGEKFFCCHLIDGKFKIASFKEMEKLNKA